MVSDPSDHDVPSTNKGGLFSPYIGPILSKTVIEEYDLFLKSDMFRHNFH